MKGRVCHTLALRRGLDFEVITGLGDRDPISQEIQEGEYGFPALFELGFALIQPGDVVLDLGAHIGTFALGAAALGCRVVAVEASPYNTSLLRHSAAQNSYEQLHVISAAVSDHSGTIEFVPSGPFGMVANPRNQSPTIQVPAVRMDDLLDALGWHQVRLIKIDVEGSEIAALRGMYRLLSRADAPMILYESNGYTLSLFDQSPKRLIATMTGFGFDNYRVEDRQLVPVGVDDLQFEGNVNYLAIKPPFVVPRGWRIARRPSFRKTVRQVVAACYHPNEHYRAYTARTLAEAPDDILNHWKVKQALNWLKENSQPDIRAAAAWWTGTNSRTDPLPKRMRQAAYEAWRRVWRTDRQ